MSLLHKQIFQAIEELPRPITPEGAMATGLTLIVNNAPAQQQWQSWMESNGTQLCQMLNKGAT